MLYLVLSGNDVVLITPSHAEAINVANAQDEVAATVYQIDGHPVHKYVPPTLPPTPGG